MQNTLNKQQFAQYISEHFNCNDSVAYNLIDIFTESLISAVAEGNTIHIDRLGKFGKTTIKPRKIYHLRKGKIIDIPALQ